MLRRILHFGLPWPMRSSSLTSRFKTQSKFSSGLLGGSRTIGLWRFEAPANSTISWNVAWGMVLETFSFLLRQISHCSSDPGWRSNNIIVHALFRFMRVVLMDASPFRPVTQVFERLLPTNDYFSGSPWLNAEQTFIGETTDLKKNARCDPNSLENSKNWLFVLLV